MITLDNFISIIYSLQNQCLSGFYLQLITVEKRQCISLREKIMKLWGTGFLEDHIWYHTNNHSLGRNTRNTEWLLLHIC